MIYKKTKNGKYYTVLEDGQTRFVSRDKVPVNALVALDKTSASKFEGCVFCGADGPRKRLVIGVMVALCDEHYYSETIGRIVQQLRERNTNVHQATSQ